MMRRQDRLIGNSYRIQKEILGQGEKSSSKPVGVAHVGWNVVHASRPNATRSTKVTSIKWTGGRKGGLPSKKGT